jgi:hypothetical protein
MGYDKNGVLGGVTSGAFRAEPWHGFGDSTNNKGQIVGTKVPISDSVRTGRELLVTAGLDWSVEKRTLADLGVTLENADDHAAIIRSDKGSILGMHSDRYGEVQNEVLGQYADVLFQARGDAFPVSAVELWGGKVIFLVVEFRDMVKVVRRDGTDEDKMTRYMGIYTSHDGSYPLSVKYMNNLWVCQNTFTPWNADSGLTVRHTRNAKDIAVQGYEQHRSVVRNTTRDMAAIRRLMDDKFPLTNKAVSVFN